MKIIVIFLIVIIIAIILIFIKPIIKRISSWWYSQKLDEIDKKFKKRNK
jgi:hypothetical protein